MHISSFLNDEFNKFIESNSIDHFNAAKKIGRKRLDWDTPPIKTDDSMRQSYQLVFHEILMQNQRR